MFELERTTKVLCTNANPRRELHGKDEQGKSVLVRAIDLTFRLTDENHILDLIEDGLRKQFYRNIAVEKHGQETVAGIEIPLPDLRFPRLPTEGIAYGDKSRGYRWIWDWGTEDDHVDFSDCAVGGMKIVSVEQGGRCTLQFTVSYNGEELNDNEIYGELSALASEGEVHIRLLAPPELMEVKKGYRAGRPDTPPKATNPAQQELPSGGDEDGADTTGTSEADGGVIGDVDAFDASEDGADVVHAAGSPEAALAATDQAQLH